MISIPYHIILASKSPRRKQLLEGLSLTFEIKTKDTDESFSPDLQKEDIALYLAQKKADAFTDLKNNELLITADTIVWIENQVLNKPENRNEAIKMLEMLSGKKHDVYTGVCIKTNDKTITFYDQTEVYFKALNINEIEFYVDNYAPYDKAGSYGAQDWIGFVAIEKMIGSYFNVMGLPVHKVYDVLKSFS